MAQPAQPSSEAVQQQQARQQALTGLLAASLLSAWATVDVTDLAGTLPKFKLTVAGLVRKYGQSSAVLAARFYQQERAAAGVPGRHNPALADPAGLEQVQKSVGWATKGLWAVPKAPQDAVAALPAPVSVDVPTLVSNAQTLVKGVTQKMVVDTGRNTLIAAIEADRKARGWAREARPDGCYFCAMLSTRGVVYKTEQTAGFEPHNNCHCIPVPLFADHYEPPAHVRQWEQIYRDSTRGKSNAAARNAFRVALEAHRNANTAAPEPALV